MQHTSFLMHADGTDHPACSDCVRLWTIQKIDHPSCPTCRCDIDPSSVLPPNEYQDALDVRAIEVVHTRQEQLEADARMARELAVEGDPVDPIEEGGAGAGMAPLEDVVEDHDFAMALVLHEEMNGEMGPPAALPGDEEMARALEADLNDGIRRRGAAAPMELDLPLIPDEALAPGAPPSRADNNCGAITAVICAVAIAAFSFLLQSS